MRPPRERQEPCPPAERNLADSLERAITGEPLYGAAMAFVLARMPDLRRCVVLEIGCGGGEMSALFALKGASVVGVDLRAEALGQARRRAASHGVSSQCAFVRGNAEGLPLPGDCVDVVYSRSTLQYMERRKALDEIRRVLRPGGSLVLVENLPFNPIILAYRMVRRLTHRDATRRKYVRSIRGYVRSAELEALSGSFRSACQQRYHLLRMLSLPGIRVPLVPRVLDAVLARVDRFVLERLAFARRFAWFVAAVYVGLKHDPEKPAK